VAAYTFFLVLGAAVTLLWGWAAAMWGGLGRWRALGCLLLPALLSPLGARLFYAAAHIPAIQHDPARLWAWELTDLAMFGGLLVALPAGWAACRLLAVSSFRLADALVPALGVGIALARMGCFLAGCCFGRETSLPWGVSFPRGSPAHLYQVLDNPLAFLRQPPPVYPTQLYEMTGALVGAGLVCWLSARAAGRGRAWGAGAKASAFLAWYSAFRVLNGYLRAPSPGSSLPLWFYTLLYGGLALAALLAWALQRRRVRHWESPASSEPWAACPAPRFEP